MVTNTKTALRLAGRMIDLWLPEKIRYAQIPGLSVALVTGGEIVYQRGFGVADRSRRTPTSVRTQYRIASISKVFTALAILQLVEARKARLGDSIARYIPELPLNNALRRRLTIARLLTHTSGIWRDGDTPHWETDRFPRSLRLSRLTAASMPGRHGRFKYSNFGYALLGEVIRRVSGMEYAEYLKRNIFRPLGMRDSAGDYVRGHHRVLATGYSRPIPGQAIRLMPHMPTNASAAAAGCLSSAADLAKLLTALSPSRRSLFSPRLKRMMMRPWTSVGHHREHYGFGLGIWKTGKELTVGHGGGFAGFTTMVAYLPKRDIGVITLSNALGSVAPGINEGIIKAILYFLDHQSRFSLVRSRQHRRYEGLYRGRWGDDAVISTGRNLLVFNPRLNDPVGKAATFRPAGKGAFTMDIPERHDAVDEPARFVSDRSGRVQRLFRAATPMRRVR